MLAYLQLLRLPTVFTAMADIFLGFLLTHDGITAENWPRFAWLLTASSCLYLAGMVFNDVFDVKQDTIERPTRPIPSGRVSRKNAALLGCALLILGLFAANVSPKSSLHVAVLLVAAILAYDGFLKRTPLGPLGMGLCRFLNVLLGASDITWQRLAEIGVDVPITCATGLGLYIVGVTWFARTEAKTSSRGQLIGAVGVLLCGIALLAKTVYGLPGAAANPMVVYLILGMIAANVSLRALSAIGDPVPERVQPVIPLMLLSYVMLCATMVYWKTGNGNYALATACLVIPALALKRVIPMT